MNALAGGHEAQQNLGACPGQAVTRVRTAAHSRSHRSAGLHMLAPCCVESPLSVKDVHVSGRACGSPIITHACTVSAAGMMARRWNVLLFAALLLALCLSVEEVDARRRHRKLASSNRRGNFDFFFLVRCVCAHARAASAALARGVCLTACALLPCLQPPSLSRQHPPLAPAHVCTQHARRQWPATFCNDHHCTHRPPQK